jgi:hypothetical protein
VSLNRLPPARLAISPPRPHHNPSRRETWYQAKKIVRRLHSRAYRYFRIRPNPARDLGLRPAHPCATSPRRSVQRRSSAHPITTESWRDVPGCLRKLNSRRTKCAIAKCSILLHLADQGSFMFKRRATICRTLATARPAHNKSLPHDSCAARRTI